MGSKNLQVEFVNNKKEDLEWKWMNWGSPTEDQGEAEKQGTARLYFDMNLSPTLKY